MKLISSPTIELGYSTFGPIINFTCSISSQKKDALIEKIVLKVTHEKGDSRLLTWKFLNEIQHHIRSYTGETAEISKSQPAIALKVPTISLVEKIIGFQDLDYLEKFKAKIDKVTDEYNFLKGEHAEAESKRKLISTKAYRDLVDFFKNSMYWQEGNYNIDAIVREVSVKEPFTEKFRFSLSKIDIETLNHNRGNLERGLHVLMLEPIDEDKKNQLPTWNWVYPVVESIS